MKVKGLQEQIKAVIKDNIEKVSYEPFTIEMFDKWCAEIEEQQRNQIEEKRNYYTNKVFLELLDDSSFMGLCNYVIITGGQETIDYTQKRYAEINKERNE